MERQWHQHRSPKCNSHHSTSPQLMKKRNKEERGGKYKMIAINGIIAALTAAPIGEDESLQLVQHHNVPLRVCIFKQSVNQ